METVMTLVFMSVIVGFLVAQTIVFLSLWKEQVQTHQEEKKSWEIERERLLNRMMTKDWESYAQLNSRIQTHSVSEGEPKGMSDEEELRRIGELTNIDPLFSYESEMSELGNLLPPGDS